MLEVKATILRIAKYVAGMAALVGITNPTRLASNENGLGCSPKALEAYRKYDSLNRYPDPTSNELRGTIGAVHKLDPERIICGAGSDEILELIPAAYAPEGTQVLYPEYGFLIYRIAALKAGATPKTAPETNLRVDVKAMIAAVTDKTRVVFVANPANPTGTYITKNEMKELRDGLPANVLLVIDSAYAEAVTADDYSDGRELVDATDNTIMTRTLSKLYGLAGLRVGWAYGPAEVIDILNRIRPPFNITGASQAAGVAAVLDQEFLQKSKDHNTEFRGKLFAELRNLGIQAVSSQTNFVTVRFGTEDDAKVADKFLKSRGVIVRDLTNYMLPEFLRITIGSEKDMQIVFKALREYKQQITSTLSPT